MRILLALILATPCAACSVSLWAGPYELSVPAAEAEATPAPEATPTP